jgi:uncharacterized protein
MASLLLALSAFATAASPGFDRAKGASEAEQRGWVKERDDCWKDGDQTSCIASSYRKWIAELKDRWKGGFRT